MWPLRDKEGLPQYKAWFPLPGEALPDSPVTEITENGIRYWVDVGNGQKTGFFLDQKYNRRAVARLARGKTVLDCFTHTGSFALNAAMAGAAHVTAVDVSESAVEMARANAERNRSFQTWWSVWQPMCLICCRPWKRNRRVMTLSFWTRLRSPNPGRPWPEP